MTNFNEYQNVELESDDKIITMMIIRKESHDVGACKQQGAQHLHDSGTYFNSLHVQISYFCRTLELWNARAPVVNTVRYVNIVSSGCFIAKNN